MTTTVYSGRVTNWPMFWAVNVLAVILIGLSGLPHVNVLSILPAVLVVLVANATVTSLRTTAGPQGVVARYGVFGLPRFSYRPDRIERAEAINIPFSKMGGWGVHWSPWRGTRLTIRSGPSLQLHLVDGRRVAISAKDPQAAADVINALQAGEQPAR